MKTQKMYLVILLLAALTAMPGTVSAQGKSQAKKSQDTQKNTKNTQLFNGKDLKNWEFYLRDPSVKASTIFTVQNGVIHIKGDPFGYMRTKQQYSDYNLHLEYRYPTELTNSGVFIHAQKPDTIWPKTVEVQLKAASAGDFVCMNGAEMTEQKDKSVRVIKKMSDSNEKPVSEWNSLDIKCEGNTIEVTVNGKLQNKGTGINISKGHICLQSEGKDIEFRNVFITKLK